MLLPCTTRCTMTKCPCSPCRSCGRRGGAAREGRRAKPIAAQRKITVELFRETLLLGPQRLSAITCTCHLSRAAVCQTRPSRRPSLTPPRRASHPTPHRSVQNLSAAEASRHNACHRHPVPRRRSIELEGVHCRARRLPEVRDMTQLPQWSLRRALSRRQMRDRRGC